MVLANWPAYPSFPVPGITTVADICADASSIFQALTSFSDLTPGTATPMPFFGIHEYPSLQIPAGWFCELLEPISLLRAMAKVEVSLIGDDGTQLTGVELCGYNRSGFSAPDAVDSQHDYYGTAVARDHDWLHSHHLRNNANDASAASRRLAFARQTSGKWIAYIPEFRNVAADGTPYDSAYPHKHRRRKGKPPAHISPHQQLGALYS